MLYDTTGPYGWLGELYAIAAANPFFYMIDGFRYGFIGQSDGTLAIGIAVMLGINAALAALLLRMLSSGYKLKA